MESSFETDCMNSNDVGTNKFISNIRNTTNKVEKEIEQKIKERMEMKKIKEQERLDTVRNEIFNKLTSKYFNTIVKGIKSASKNGKHEKYINFARNDFKANCKGLGYPQEVANSWLSEMTTIDSVFLPICNETNDDWKEGEKMNINGITYKVWNNRSFTIVFSW
tara:strand:+ start:64 stop:555 length:492 start_codon:yes stop_codon:yes gene_type:complete